MNVTFSSRPGRRVSSINGLRIVLIACALLFSLYAGIRVMSPSQRAKKTAQQLELSSTEGVQRRHRMLGHEGEDKSVQHSGLKEGSMVDGEEQGVSCSTAVTTPPCPACPACEAKAEAQDQRPQYLPVARYLRYVPSPPRIHLPCKFYCHLSHSSAASSDKPHLSSPCSTPWPPCCSIPSRAAP